MTQLLEKLIDAPVTIGLTVVAIVLSLTVLRLADALGKSNSRGKSRKK